ncbi:hypothetical protein [Streptomyces sp. NPDC005989]|uniref:hypothetical protein n=1 Tax=Streptomyces sp. NPDC005989 TaxID=3156727 RepID=UPI0033D0A34E
MPCRHAPAPAPFRIGRARGAGNRPAVSGVIFSAAVLLVALFAISNKKQQAVHDEAAGAPA